MTKKVVCTQNVHRFTIIVHCSTLIHKRKTGFFKFNCKQKKDQTLRPFEKTCVASFKCEECDFTSKWKRSLTRHVADAGATADQIQDFFG